MGEYIDSTHGRLYQEGGEVHLRSKDGSQFAAASPEQAQALLDSGEMIPATADEVAEHVAQARSGTLGGQAQALAEGAGAGFFAGALALPKLATAGAEAIGLVEEDPLADVSGRGTIAAVRGLIGEAAGGELGVAERQYEEAARERAQVNPLASGAGQILGNVAGSGLALGTGGLVARGAGALGAGALGRTATQFAVEGAIEGAAGASEDSFINDYELTAEQMWVGAGIGAALGIGTAGAFAAPGRLRRVFGKADDLPTGHKPAVPSGTDLESAAAQTGLIGKPAAGFGAKARDALESLQKTAVGADDDAAEAISSYGATRWDDKARRGRDLYANRRQIVDDASSEIAERLDKIGTDVDSVLEDAVDGGARLERMRELVADGDSAVQLRAAREQMDSISALMDDIAPAQRAKPPKGASAAEREAYDTQRALEAQVEERLGNRASRQKTAKYIRRLQERMAEADAGEAYWLVDEAKRTLQREVKGLNQSATSAALRQGDRVQARELSAMIERVQEPVRQSLMDEAVWGKAAKWQTAKNKAFEDFIRTSREFRGNLTRQVEGVDYRTGRPVYATDPSKVRTFIGRMGTADGRISEQYVMEHMEATRRLTDAIADGGDPEKFAASLARIRDGYKAVDETLAKAGETVKVANQIDAVVRAEREGAFGSVFGGAALGGLLGGAPGALLGGAVSAVTRPGTLLRQASAVQSLAKQVDARVDGAIVRFLSRKGPKIKVTGAVKPKRPKLDLPSLPEFGGTGATQIPRAAITPQAVRFALPGKSDLESFEQRANEIEAMADGRKLIDYGSQNLTGMASEMPRIYGAMIGKASAASGYLRTKIPTVAMDPELQRLGVVPPADQLQKFRTAWETVMSPQSVLDSLEQGFVDPEAVEALKAVYPRMWQRLRERTMAQLAALEEPPPLQVRAQLDLLLEMNGAIEPTLAPERLARNAPLAAARQQNNAPQGPPTPGKHMPDVASQFETTTQRIV